MFQRQADVVSLIAKIGEENAAEEFVKEATAASISAWRHEGHKSLAQTGTYLNVTRIGLQESMRKYDEDGEGPQPLVN